MSNTPKRTAPNTSEMDVLCAILKTMQLNGEQLDRVLCELHDCADADGYFDFGNVDLQEIGCQIKMEYAAFEPDEDADGYKTVGDDSWMARQDRSCIDMGVV